MPAAATVAYPLRRKIHIGSFKVPSGVLRITDPCFELDHKDGLSLCVAKGEYNAFTWWIDGGSFGHRIGWMEIQSTKHEPYTGWIKAPSPVCVDTGTMALFDECAQGEQDETSDYYEEIDKNGGHGVLANGAACSSGFGDGWYEVFSRFRKHSDAVHVRVVFLGRGPRLWH